MALIQSTTTEERDPFAYTPDVRSFKSMNVGQTERWLSVIGGAGLALYGLLRRDWTGAIIATISVPVIYRGATGHSFLYQAMDVTTVEQSPSTILPIPGKKGIRVKRAMTVNRSAEDLYNFWSDIEKAPLYMQHIESVTKTGDRTSHWVAKGLLGNKVEWNSELLQDIHGKVISWHVHGKPTTANAGKVTFEPAQDGRSTVVTLELDYFQFGGALGTSLGTILGHIPEKEVETDVRHFKELMEAGEIPTIKGQPTGMGRK